MDNDLDRLIRTLGDGIADLEPGRDLQRIGLKQTYAGALYAISMASRHGYEELVRPRPGADEQRERDLCDAALHAMQSADAAPAGDWLGEFYFNSALLRVAATTHATLKYHYMPLFGEGFCSSQVRLEEQAHRDGLVTDAELALLQSIRQDVDGYKHEYGTKGNRKVTRLAQLVAGLGILVRVAHGFPALPTAGKAKA